MAKKTSVSTDIGSEHKSFKSQTNNVLDSKAHKVWNRRKIVKTFMFIGGFLLGAAIAAAIIIPFFVK